MSSNGAAAVPVSLDPHVSSMSQKQIDNEIKARLTALLETRKQDEEAGIAFMFAIAAVN
mgnify:CR=1 FL=1